GAGQERLDPGGAPLASERVRRPARVGRRSRGAVELLQNGCLLLGRRPLGLLQVVTKGGERPDGLTTQQRRRLLVAETRIAGDTRQGHFSHGRPQVAEAVAEVLRVAPLAKEFLAGL